MVVFFLSPCSLQAHVLWEGLIAETPIQLESWGFLKLPGRSFVPVLLSFPSWLVLTELLQQELCPSLMSCPRAVMGEADPGSRLEGVKVL